MRTKLIRHTLESFACWTNAHVTRWDWMPTTTIHVNISQVNAYHDHVMSYEMFTFQKMFTFLWTFHKWMPTMTMSWVMKCLHFKKYSLFCEHFISECLPWPCHNMSTFHNWVPTTTILHTKRMHTLQDANHVWIPRKKWVMSHTYAWVMSHMYACVMWPMWGCFSRANWMPTTTAKWSW